MKWLPIVKKIGGSPRYPKTVRRQIIGWTRVDSEYYDYLSQFIWGFVDPKHSRPARRVNGKHHYIQWDVAQLAGWPVWKYLDHIDNNPLHNEISNLRPTGKDSNGRSLNGANSKLWKNNTSGFKGVTVVRYGNSTRNRYIAHIMHNKKGRDLGSYDDPILAAKAYDRAAIKAFGEFARGNKMLGLI